MKNNKETLRLWKKLKKLGNFSDAYYDKCIIDDLKQAIHVDGDFENAIFEISPEDFLSSFFNVISPLISMYTDILLFFERCGANTGRENIELKIESDKFEFTSFNASHFMHAKEIIENISQLTNNLTIEGINKLFDVNKSFFSHWDWAVKHQIRNNTFNKWYREYFNGNAVCPAESLDFFDIIKSSPIKSELKVTYTFWTALFNFYKTFNTSRNNWREVINKQEEKGNVDLFYPETDYVLGSSLGALYYLAENYERFSQGEKDEVVILLLEFNKYISHDIVDKSIKLWEKYLKLPVWEKRYELYSVWIFSQIIEDIPNDNLIYNVLENTLHFTFSKELIASATFKDKKVDFWNELKTNKIENLLGRGRKHNIQPDYSIVCGSPDDIENSIAVVECKQYKTPSYTNFSHAIIDYSNNRPNAKIFLVDYGDFNINTLSSKITTPRERYELLPMCRPNNESKKTLSKNIWDLVRQHIGITSFLDDTAIFTLKWNEKPADLDLHLLFKGNHLKDSYRLCYNSKDVPGAEYSGDITLGFGPESITINNWNDGIYDLWCHNYSGSPSLSTSGAILTANFSGLETLILECPREGGFQWWHILTIDTHKCEVKIVNELVLQ